MVTRSCSWEEPLDLRGQDASKLTYINYLHSRYILLGIPVPESSPPANAKALAWDVYVIPN